MKIVLTTLAVAAIAAGTASIASADTYVYVPNGYSYYTVPNTGTYDRDNSSMRSTITNPGGEGGGVQNPHLGSGINGSDTRE